MQIQIEMKGLQQFQERISKAPDKAADATELAMKAFVVKVKREVKDSLNEREKTTGSRGGKIYIPSEPGTPPHKRTGHLFKSVYNRVNRLSKMVIQGIVGDNALSDDEYAYPIALEFGTSKMPMRPYLRPVVDKNAIHFEELMKEALSTI